MLIIGLTGGIGSGKSAVATLFAERGVPIIDTDIIARDLTQAGKAAFQRIIEHFGNSILLENGSLDRAKLRMIIFSNPKQRLWLERLLHPLIQKEMEQEISQLSSPYCIAVVPLLFEVEFYSIINRILVVDTPEHMQIERVMSRDKISQEHVEKILKTQANREDRLARAQDIIINDGHLADLIPQVDKLHQMYLKMSEDK